MGGTCCAAKEAQAETTKIEVETSTLSQGVQVKEEPRMVLGFECPDGTAKDIVFWRRPMGIDFDKSVPLIVKKVHPSGHAEQQGVEKGWRVVHVNDESLKDLSFEGCFKILKGAASKLPEIAG
mmetsp:Transcript_54434/g.129726  ORF Transcript_54434/g.129726 Transcript_54434/m.129726 type:complete len:123 (+) Transcript_54434:121-489(+)